MDRIDPVRAILGCLLLLALATPGAAQPSPAWTDWARVRSVAIGDEITVTTTAWAGGDYRMAFADNSLLVLVKPLDRISPVVLDAMRRVGPNWPAILAGRVVVDGAVRISKGGIQETGFPVATIEVMPRETVSEVRRTRKTSAASVLLDVASISALVAASRAGQYSPVGPDTRSGTYSHEAEVRRYQDYATTSLVRNFGRPGKRLVNPRDIIYSTSNDPFFPPMDDDAWQQLLQGVPPSLRGTGAIVK